MQTSAKHNFAMEPDTTENIVGRFNVQLQQFAIVKVGSPVSEGGIPIGMRNVDGTVGGFSIGDVRYVIRQLSRLPSMREVSCSGLPSLLSLRELQVCALVAKGCVNKQIARQLDLSEHTVASYLGRIYSKLDLHCRAAVAAWYTDWEHRIALKEKID